MRMLMLIRCAAGSGRGGDCTHAASSRVCNSYLYVALQISGAVIRRLQPLLELLEVGAQRYVQEAAESGEQQARA